MTVMVSALLPHKIKKYLLKSREFIFSLSLLYLLYECRLMLCDKMTECFTNHNDQILVPKKHMDENNRLCPIEKKGNQLTKDWNTNTHIHKHFPTLQCVGIHCCVSSYRMTKSPIIYLCIIMIFFLVFSIALSCLAITTSRNEWKCLYDWGKSFLAAALLTISDKFKWMCVCVYKFCMYAFVCVLDWGSIKMGGSRSQGTPSTPSSPQASVSIVCLKLEGFSGGAVSRPRRTLVQNPKGDVSGSLAVREPGRLTHRKAGGFFSF